jgi:signal transduction histidine kinase
MGSELEDRAARERKAREGHDRVLQHLFATALSLQSILLRNPEPEIRALVEESVAALDRIIAEVRATLPGQHALP